MDIFNSSVAGYLEKLRLFSSKFNNVVKEGVKTHLVLTTSDLLSICVCKPDLQKPRNVGV